MTGELDRFFARLYRVNADGARLIGSFDPGDPARTAARAELGQAIDAGGLQAEARDVRSKVDAWVRDWFAGSFMTVYTTDYTQAEEAGRAGPLLLDAALAILAGHRLSLEARDVLTEPWRALTGEDRAA
jgi:hypothetical protein